MARRPDSKQATETLEEIEGFFDKVADWVTHNPRIVLSALGGVLGLAAVVGFTQSYAARGELKASEAVAGVENAYRQAMGAGPGDIEISEPANPETGRQARADYAGRLSAVADEHAGSLAAVHARILAGTLLEQNGDLTGAVESWRAAADEGTGGSLHGLALLRLASGLERLGDWQAAAEAYAQAGALASFPGRHLALAQAARSWISAGDPGRALDAYAKLEASDPPEGTVPPYIESQLQELRAQQGAATDPS